MDYLLHFAHITVLYVLVPVLALIAYIRLRYHKPVIYHYPLTTLLQSHGMVRSHPSKKVFFALRFVALGLLAFLIAKPQLIDTRSKMPVEGIDMVLALDVSGSMNMHDNQHDDKSRLDVAKEEAIRFVQKRPNDAIGLVIFAQDAVSRAPLTLDKQMLTKIIDEIKLGIIDYDGTRLANGMVTAANRLKKSKAKSKVMILLTDGEPSPGDLDMNTAVEVAKRLGIKVYTVGIGNDKDEHYMHPFYGVQLKPKVNTRLLKAIAQHTGGQFFMAHDAQDMRRIYDTIDRLEKREHEVPIFTKFYDIFVPFVFIIISMLFSEIVLASSLWFGL